MVLIAACMSCNCGGLVRSCKAADMYMYKAGSPLIIIIIMVLSLIVG
jgi:hypothetical protein